MKILFLILILCISPNLFSQTNFSYEGTNRPKDNAWVFSFKANFRVDKSNQVKGVILWTYSEINKPNEEYVNTYKKQYKYSDSSARMVALKIMRQDIGKSSYEFITGTFNPQTKIITAKTESEIDPNNFVTFSNYKFKQIDNNIIELDTTGIDKTIMKGSISSEDISLSAKLDEKESSEKEVAAKKKLAAQIEVKRIAFLKKATVGDMLVYTQDWEQNETYLFGFYKKNTPFKMIIKAFIERIEGEKFQIRIADISSTNSDKYATPEIKGVKTQKGDIIWVKPFQDQNWFWGEDE